MNLIPITSYTPPYRGDLKGIVEVLHRIEKDSQFLFIPGAMDYRREELELRRIDPNECVMTLPEYVAFLHELFAEYNLTADRRHRVDAHMEAAGVFPSPAGLWAWGHAMGIGVRRHVDETDLITTLLPRSTARVRRDAIRFAKCDYMSEQIRAAQWTAIARNFGGWDIPVYHYPGSMSTIWTPNQGGVGMLRLTLSPQSKVGRDVSLEEYLDSCGVATMRQATVDHIKKMHSVDFDAKRRALIERAEQLTVEALGKASGKAPTMKEARQMEPTACGSVASSEATHAQPSSLETLDAHQKLMDAILGKLNAQEAVRD
jgi:hypothetical protein